MLEEVLRFIRREKMITEGDTVLVGISGGADSVCLLCVLDRLKEQIDFTLGAVHVEHGIRGEESRLDAAFVEQLCAIREIPCQVYRVNVPEYAKMQGLGLEEAARILRYECYEKAAEKYSGTVKIALAHHAEDNAETVLFQLIRGSGLDGLCGMQPERGLTEHSRIIRPLLKQSREAIEAYLKEIGQEFRTDGTNLDTDYSRNCIRHRVLPELMKINRQAVSHINRSAEILTGLKEDLDSRVAEIYKKACENNNGRVTIEKTALETVPEVIRLEVIHKAICEAAGSSKDITSAHVESVAALFDYQCGKRISLPYGLIAERVYKGIWLEKAAEKEGGQEFFVTLGKEELETLLNQKPYIVDVPGGTIRLQLLDFRGKKQEISKKRYTKWLNYDKIKNGLQIRNRQSGDYLTLDQEGHKKRLKEYFINEKIPSREREHVLLLAQGSHIIWVIGGRISAGFKIDGSTERILEVQIDGGNYHEDQED